MHVIHRLPSFLVALLLSLPPAANAQPKRSKQQLKQEYREALRLAQQGKKEQAIALWEDVLTQAEGKTRQESLFNLAFAYLDLDRLPEAWHHLSLYVLTLEREDKETRKKLAGLEELLPEDYVKVGFTCQPDGALVYVGRHSRGIPRQCPLDWWFEPGKRAVHVVKEGFQATIYEFDVRRGRKPASHLVTLRPKKKTERGLLIVEGSGSTIQVFLDGNLAGGVPFRRKLEPGTYELRVDKPGRRPWRKMILVKAGKTLTERPPMARPGATKMPGDEGETDSIPSRGPAGIADSKDDDEGFGNGWKWTLVGVGTAAAVAGGILQYGAHSNELELHEKYKVASQQAGYNSDFEAQVRPKLTGAYILYGVGGAAILTGLVALAVGDGEDPSDKKLSLLSPLLMPGHTGLSLRVGF